MSMTSILIIIIITCSSNSCTRHWCRYPMGFCYWVIPKWVKPAIALFLLATGVLPLLASIPRAISGAECPGYVIEKEALGGVEGIDLRRYEAFPVAQMVRVPWVTRAPGV